MGLHHTNFFHLYLHQVKYFINTSFPFPHASYYIVLPNTVSLFYYKVYLITYPNIKRIERI